MVDENLGGLGKLCLRLTDVPERHVGLGELEAGLERKPRECTRLGRSEPACEGQLAPGLFEPATPEERSREDADLEHPGSDGLGAGAQAMCLLGKHVARDVIASLGRKHGSDAQGGYAGVGRSTRLGQLDGERERGVRRPRLTE